MNGEQKELDLEHYRESCTGCQFSNLLDYDKKCPYFIKPKTAQLAKRCFFREFVTLKDLKNTESIKLKQTRKKPKVVSDFLNSNQSENNQKLKDFYKNINNSMMEA